MTRSPSRRSDERSATPHPEASAEGTGTAPRRGRPSLNEAQQLADRILNAGWEVLLAEGFEGFTFDKLARHARIGKATIYARFPNKRAFMQALLEFYISRRRTIVEAQGIGLPLVEEFTVKAITAIQMLISPDGILTERLIDWLDQEPGAPGRVRTHVYRTAIEAIERALIEANASKNARIEDPLMTARFWFEGLIGHARLAKSEGATEPEQTAAWARKYSEYFFRSAGAA